MNKSDENEKSGIRKLNSDFFRALDECADALSLSELSRISGVRIELLRRYLDRKVRHVRSETWDKIYPVLKPYLQGPEPPQEPPPRIGGAYRRHPELVEMLSEQKVLLDVFNVFSAAEQKKIIRDFVAAAGDTGNNASSFSSLSNGENQLMGAFLAMDKETRETQLSALTKQATAEVRRRRTELF